MTKLVIISIAVLWTVMMCMDKAEGLPQYYWQGLALTRPSSSHTIISQPVVSKPVVSQPVVASSDKRQQGEHFHAGSVTYYPDGSHSHDDHHHHEGGITHYGSHGNYGGQGVHQDHEDHEDHKILPKGYERRHRF